MGWFISINFYLVVETKKGLLGLSSRVRTIKIDEEAAGGRPRAPVPFVLRCHIARVNIARKGITVHRTGHRWMGPQARNHAICVTISHGHFRGAYPFGI